MAMNISWDAPTESFFENGIDRGVLFPQVAGAYEMGYPWNGLTNVTESPEGAEPTDLWANNNKYATMISAESYKGSITAYTYPDEFEACDGSASPEAGLKVFQQARQPFGVAYRTLIHSSGDGEMGYKLHLVYGCLVTPSEKSWATVNDSPEAVEFSWDFSTTPVAVTGYKPTSTMVIDSRTTDPAKLAWLEEQLYGVDSPVSDPRMPLPDEIINWAP